MNPIYFQLRALFQADEPHYFKLQQLSDQWLCTPKQTKRRLNMLQEQGSLHYIPGKGRGNPSKIVFTHSLKDDLDQILQQLLATNDISGILNLLDFGFPTHFFDRYYEKIQSLFGLQENASAEIKLPVIIHRPLTTIDPIKAAVYRESFILKQLGDTLVTINERKLAPAIAHHWSIENNACTWRFFLRKGVKFHHGKTLTSRDVAYTITRCMQKGANTFTQLKNIQQIELLSDYEIVFHLEHSEPFFGHLLANHSCIILPEDIPFDEKKFISCGPFKLNHYGTTTVSLKAFDHYYGFRALIDEIEFFIDFTDSSKLTDYEQVQTNNIGVEFLIFNQKRDTVVNDLHFREALYHLLDNQQLLKDIGADLGSPASRYFPKESALLHKSLTKAKAALKKSTYNGETLHLGYLPMFQKAIHQSEWLQKRAEKIGISFKRIPFTFNKEFFTSSMEKNMDMVMIGDIPMSDDELSFLDFCTNGTLLLQRFLSTENQNHLQEKVTHFKFEQDTEKRWTLYQEIDRWLIDNYFLIYIIHPHKQNLVHTMLHNNPMNVAGYYDFKNVWEIPTKKK